MKQIFISHRWKDDRWSAQHLVEKLIAAFPAQHIFFDQNDRLHGLELKPKLVEEVMKSQVFVLLVGERWLRPVGQGDDKFDYIRLEVETALKHGLKIIPVVIDDATMPTENELGALSPIAGIVHVSVKIESLEFDFELVRRAISAALGSVENKRFAIADMGTVLRWGWDSDMLLEKLVAFDRQEIEPDAKGDPKKPEFDDLHEGTIDQWKEIFWRRPEHWRLVIEGKSTIVGYWEMHVLFDEFCQKVKTGRLADGQLGVDMMPDYWLGGEYPAYFSMIGVDHNCQFRGKALQMLVESFFSVLYSGTIHGLFITEIVARAWTGDGSSHCRKMGLKPVKTRKNAIVPIDHWSGSISEILKQTRANLYPNIEKLRERYAQHGLLG